MKYVLSIVAAVALVATAHAASSGEDDQTKIQEALRAQGYTQWKRIEHDKGLYEVDDAIDSAGKQFDLRIDASNMKIIEKDAED